VVPSPPAPQPPPAQPQGPPPEIVRANRLLAGKRCPACQREVLLGQEVIQCPRCGEPSHKACWEERGGCAALTCAPQQPAAAPAAAPATRQCPACAEQIPATATVCPYCSEPLGRRRRQAAPTTFTAREGAFGTRGWTFKNRGDVLLAIGPEAEGEFRVHHDKAAEEVVLKRRKLQIATPSGWRSFKIDDIGYVAASFWLHGRPKPVTCSLATDALAWAILGIFCCQIIFGPVALIQASRAQQVINRHPRVITGRGLVTAARIIGVIDIILFVVVIIARLGSM
jgi:hypothetical protein